MADTDVKQLARDYVLATPHSGDDDIINELKSGMPDIAVAIDDVVAENGEVVALWHSTGKQTRSLWGVEPTGRDVRTRHFTRFVIGDGEILSVRTLTDRMSILAQLGSVGRYAPDFGLAPRSANVGVR